MPIRRVACRRYPDPLAGAEQAQTGALQGVRREGQLDPVVEEHGTGAGGVVEAGDRCLHAASLEQPGRDPRRPGADAEPQHLGQVGGGVHVTAQGGQAVDDELGRARAEVLGT